MLCILFVLDAIFQLQHDKLCRGLKNATKCFSVWYLSFREQI
jgi:hypothetical protein